MWLSLLQTQEATFLGGANYVVPSILISIQYYCKVDIAI